MTIRTSMRIVIIISFLFFALQSTAQKYSSAIPDTMIMNLMKWVIPKDSAAVTRNRISESKEMIACSDSMRSAIKNYWSSAFKDYQLTGILKQSDADYFAEQFCGLIAPASWDLPFGSFVENNKTDNDQQFYIFSIPLFSLNKNYAVIHSFYSLSPVSGGTHYYLYKRKKDNSWELVKMFGGWAE